MSSLDYTNYPQTIGGIIVELGIELWDGHVLKNMLIKRIW